MAAGGLVQQPLISHSLLLAKGRVHSSSAFFLLDLNNIQLNIQLSRGHSITHAKAVSIKRGKKAKAV